MEGRPNLINSRSIWSEIHISRGWSVIPDCRHFGSSIGWPERHRRVLPPLKSVTLPLWTALSFKVSSPAAWKMKERRGWPRRS